MKNIYAKESQLFDNCNKNFYWQAVTNIEGNLYKLEVRLTGNAYASCQIFRNGWTNYFELDENELCSAIGEIPDVDNPEFEITEKICTDLRIKIELKMLSYIESMMIPISITDIENVLTPPTKSDDKDAPLELDLEHMTITHNGIKYNAKEFLDNYRPFNNFDPDQEMYF